MLPGEVSIFFYCTLGRVPYRPVRGDGLLGYEVLGPLSHLIPKSASRIGNGLIVL